MAFEYRSDFKRNRNESMFLEAVLADDYYRPVNTDSAYVCEIQEKKRTSDVMRLLSAVYPLPESWCHLKRIRSDKGQGIFVIICPVAAVESESFKKSADTDKTNTNGESDLLSNDSNTTSNTISKTSSNTTNVNSQCLNSCLPADLNSKAENIITNESDTEKIRTSCDKQTSSCNKQCYTSIDSAVCVNRDIPNESESVKRCDSLLKELFKVSIEKGEDVLWLFDVLSEPFIQKIPCSAPLTRDQFNAAAKLWPTSFHEDKRIARLMRNEIFESHEEQIKAEKFMSLAFKTAAKDSQSCSNRLRIGCVIVDLVRGEVLAEASDERRVHPLRHAVMAAIDSVALQQVQQQTSTSNTDSDASSSVKTGPYLCTGYDAYITHEPCMMCSMALLHSRISRVFYAYKHVSGALGSVCKLHVIKSLNHHFEVYRGLIPTDLDLNDECIDQLYSDSEPV